MFHLLAAHPSPCRTELSQVGSLGLGKAKQSSFGDVASKHVGGRALLSLPGIVWAELAVEIGVIPSQCCHTTQPPPI